MAWLGNLPGALVSHVGDTLLGLVESRLAAVWLHLLTHLCRWLAVRSSCDLET